MTAIECTPDEILLAVFGRKLETPPTPADVERTCKELGLKLAEIEQITRDDPLLPSRND